MLLLWRPPNTIINSTPSVRWYLAIHTHTHTDTYKSTCAHSSEPYDGWHLPLTFRHEQSNMATATKAPVKMRWLDILTLCARFSCSFAYFFPSNCSFFLVFLLECGMRAILIFVCFNSCSAENCYGFSCVFVAATFIYTVSFYCCIYASVKPVGQLYLLNNITILA